jgi:hypothetical protein
MEHQAIAQILGSYGEFVGAIGVVVTLGYLSVQIRQNTKTGRAQARQTLLDQWSSSNWDLSRDPQLLRVYANALLRWPDLPNDEKTMFDFGMSRFLANIQNGLLLRDSGMIDGSTLDVLVGYMVVCVRTAGGARWWRDTINAHPETRAYIESRLANDDESAAGAESLVPYWMAMTSDVANKPRA